MTFIFFFALLSTAPVTGGLSSSNDPGRDRAAHFNRGRWEGSLTHFCSLHHLRHVHAARAAVLQRDLNAGGLHRPHFALHDIPEAVTRRARLVLRGRALSFGCAAVPRHEGEAPQLLAAGFYDLDGQTHPRPQPLRLGQKHLVQVAAGLDHGELSRVVQREDGEVTVDVLHRRCVL